MKNIKDAQSLLKKASPDLLLAGGTLSIIAGGILAVKKTPKAIKILEEEKDKKKLIPLYLPSVGLTIAGVGCIVASRNITKNRIAAVTTAYTVTDTAYRVYKNKVKEIVDEEKHKEIERETNREILKQNPVKDKEVYMTNNNDVLMYDNISGRYFTGNINDVEAAANRLNKRLMSEMSIQLNEFYAEIGLPPIKIGTELGWHIDNDIIDIDFSSSISDDGRPCVVLDYDLVMV